MPSSPTPNVDTYGTRSTRWGTNLPTIPGTTVPDWGSAFRPPAGTNIPFYQQPIVDSKTGKVVTSNAPSQLPTRREFKGGMGFRIFEAQGTDYIKFRVTPDVSETATANYVEESDIRDAASLLIYMGSPSRNFSITAKLVSRTHEESAHNFSILKKLRAWRMPDKKSEAKGGNGVSVDSGKGTPRILILQDGKLFNDVQVVMRSLTIDVNNDSDRIAIENGDMTRLPIILPISMSFQEIHAYTDIQAFDLETYKKDGLQYW